MALQVWLPLNGDLHNQGLANVTVTNNGATVNSNGKIGQCYSFDGTDDYIQLTTNSSFINNVNGFSMSIWYYCERNTESWSRLFELHNNVMSSSTGKACILLGTNNGKIGVAGRYNNSTSGGISDTLIKAVDLNKWHLYTITATSTQIKVYEDFTLIQTLNLTVNMCSQTYTHIWLGRSTWSSDSYLQGKLNDFRLYDHCLSDKEIREIAKGLVLHYKLDNNGLGGENLVTGSNTNNISTNKWVGHSAVGGNTSSIVIDETGIPCVQVTRDNVAQSSWDYLSYDNFLRNKIKTNTIYSVSFDAKPSVDGSIGFTGFVNGNATNYMTNSTTIIQGNLKANQWNHCQYLCTTINSFDNISTSGQVVYFSRSTSLRGTNVTVLFKNIKVEEGNVFTSWSPAKTDLNYPQNNDIIIYDSSGYNHNGTLVNTGIDSISPCYKVAISLIGEKPDSSSNILTGAQYLYGALPLTTPSSLTVTWWAKVNTYGRGGIFETTGSTDLPFGADYNTTAIANWDNTFRIYNGSSNMDFMSNFSRDGVWHYRTIVFNGSNAHYYQDGELKKSGTLTGTLPTITGFRIGLGRAGGVYRQINQQVSDFRIYVVALSADDIKKLYKTSKIVSGTTISSRNLE